MYLGKGRSSPVWASRRSYAFFNKLAATYGTIWVIHHNSKAKVEESTGQSRIFGSALISGAVVVAFEIDFCDCEFARKLTVSKSNMGALPLGMEIVVGRYPGKPPCVFQLEDGEPVDPGMNAQVARCCDLLMEKLIDGKPRPIAELGEHFFKKFEPIVWEKAFAKLNLEITDRGHDAMTLQLPEKSIVRRLYLGDEKAA